MTRLLLAFALIFAPFTLIAQETAPSEDTPLSQDNPPSEQDLPLEPPMTLETLDLIIKALDPEAKTNGTIWQLELADVPLIIVTDAQADRMRVMAGIRKSSEVTPDDMLRMMQSNFDSALDARYAIAQETLWATFIHPLSPLEKNELISGIGQVVNLVRSYGTAYSGGALQFGGGDSGALQRALIDELLKKGEEI